TARNFASKAVLLPRAICSYSERRVLVGRGYIAAREPDAPARVHARIQDSADFGGVPRSSGTPFRPDLHTGTEFAALFPMCRPGMPSLVMHFNLRPFMPMLSSPERSMME